MNVSAAPSGVWQLQFHKDGHFYPYVGSFLVAVAGLPGMIDPSNTQKWTAADRISLSGVLIPDREISPFEIHQEVLQGHLSHETYCTSLCVMLADTAYAVAEAHHDGSPAFEFFRHVRHASSHSNKFNFSTKEPSRPSAWRTATLDETRRAKSNPLYGSRCFGQYLGFVDILELLWDIEQLVVRNSGTLKKSGLEGASERT